MRLLNKDVPGIYLMDTGEVFVRKIIRGSGKAQETMPVGTTLGRARRKQKELAALIMDRHEKQRARKAAKIADQLETFEECCDFYELKNPEHTHGSHLKIVRNELGEASVIDEEQFRAAFESMVAEWEDEELSDGTIGRRNATVRVVINFCFKRHKIKSIPLRNFDVRPSSERDRILSPDEQERLISTLKENGSYLYFPVLFSLRDPIRRGDLGNLKTGEHLDMFNRVISFLPSKTGNRVNRKTILGRWAEIPELVEYLQSRVDVGATYLFPGPDGVSKIGDFKKHWHSMLVAANIQDFRWHDLKHCATTDMMDERDANGAYIYSGRDFEDLGISMTEAMRKRYRNRSGMGVIASIRKRKVSQQKDKEAVK